MDFSKKVKILNEGIRKVGNFLIEEYYNFEKKYAEVKGHNDLVSYVDRKAEEMLSDICFSIFSDAGIIREEAEHQNINKEWLWVIDPLDGTNNFIHGIPIFSISVALMFQRKPYLGIVYAPILREFFWAEKNKGAFLNEKPLSIRQPISFKESIIGTGFPFREREFIEPYVKLLGKFLQKTRAIRRMGSAAIDLAYVAAGRFSAFFEAHLAPWDVAAGSLLVQEAGGIVSDFAGNDNYIFGKSILAAAPALYSDVLEIIKENFNVS